jgi:hypothetical protein
VSAGAGGALRGSWGAWVSVVAENSGDVRTRRSTARAELTGRDHDAEREKRGARAMAQRLAERARETEREEGRARAKKLAPIGRPQRAESERERERERERAGEKAAATCQAVRARGRAA